MLDDQDEPPLFWQRAIIMRYHKLEVTSDDDFEMATRKRRWHRATREDP